MLPKERIAFTLAHFGSMLINDVFADISLSDGEAILLIMP